MKHACVKRFGLLAAVTLALLVAACNCASQADAAVVFTKANAPETPRLEDLPLKESVSQYGITWTFAKPAHVGQFVNGEWYVVGPVTIKAVSPKMLFGKEVPEDSIDERERQDAGGENRRLSAEEKAALKANPVYCRNGSVLNPSPVMGKSGFDSRVTHRLYDPKEVAHLPIQMKPGDALISSISKPAGLSRRGHYTPIAAAAILTCLKEPVPADAFRPSYVDRGQTIYLARNLKRDLLPKLEPVEKVPEMASLVERFRKPWLVLNIFKGDHVAHQWGGYGQRSCFYLCQCELFLCLDYPAEKKEPVLLAVVGLGIDWWGVVRSGHPGFPAWGGWNSGYKMPIVLAGYLLGDERMASPSVHYPKFSFQEDEQTAYGSAWNGAKVVFTGHSGYDAVTLKSRDKTRGRSMWGFYEHLHPSFWVKDQVQSDGYRRCCTSRTWPGQALAARLMHLEKQWAHDAYFDYVDRWMYQEETAAVWKAVSDANVRVGWKAPKDWARQGQVEDPFVEAMWKKYRKTLKAPTDGWKQEKANANGMVLPAVKMPDK